LLHFATSDSPREEDESDTPLGDPHAVDIQKLRVGVFDFDGYFQPSPAICRAVDEARRRLEESGVTTVAFAPPDISAAMALYFGLIGADGARSISDLLRGDSIDWRLNRLIRIGELGGPWRTIAAAIATMLGQPRSAMMLRATVRKDATQLAELGREIENYSQKFQRQMDALGIDAILCPPYGLPAPTHGSTLYLPPAGSYCFLANLMKLPAGVVPITTVRTGEERRPRSRVDLAERAASQVETGSAGLPIGVQILAKAWRDDVVLALLSVLDRTAPPVR
jgi:fatty acid amide hydrolase